MSLNNATLTRLQYQWESLDLILKGLKINQIQSRLDEEKWSIHENLAHLGRYQEIFFERIQIIRQGDTPSFASYSAETDAEFPAWQNSATEDVLDQIKFQRKEIFALIKNLEEDELSHLGYHPKFGLLNIPMWLEFFLLHEAHHLYTIFALVSAWKSQEMY